MNSYSSANHGKAPVRPLARRSIHSHCDGNCPFAPGEAMGRYGLNHRALGPDSSQQDIDEVDNVLSKQLRTSTSPSPIRRQNKERRHSYNIDKSCDELLSEDINLSKSLPAKFQSHYSDDNINDDLVESTSQDSYNNSHKTAISTRFRAPLSISQELHEMDQSNTSQHKENSSSSTNVFLAVCVAILSVLAYYGYQSFVSKPNYVIYDKITFSTDLSSLGKKYNVGDDSILKVQSGIVTIIDKEDAGSFIFVYNSKNSRFQKNLLNNFINDIASTSARLLRNNSAQAHYIVLESSHLNMRSHNEFMTTYRDEVDRSGVMLVKELENLPSNLAMAFHYYCDEYNPLVKKTAIFFTMDLGNCSTYDGRETSNAVIEKCLSNKWENVPQANIVPLLTRVIGVVVDVSSIF